MITKIFCLGCLTYYGENSEMVFCGKYEKKQINKIKSTNTNEYIKLNEYYIKIKGEYKKTLNSFEKFSDDLILFLNKPRKTKIDYFEAIEKIIKYRGILEYIK